MSLNYSCFWIVILIKLEAFVMSMQETPEISKIAVIGGGIGGTASAYFLRDLLGDKIEVDLYEPNTIGGRLATHDIGGRSYEIGGSIIHTENMYMQKFVKQFDLQKVVACPMKFGIYDGNEFVYSETDWTIVNIAKLLYRYGLDLYSIRKLNNKMLDQFANIYKLQDNENAYKDVNGLLNAMSADFTSIAHQSTREYLLQSGLHDRIIDEIVAAVTRANYGQLPDVQAFVGSVSMAAGNGDVLWAVKNGNKKVPEQLLRHSNANLFVRKVTKITESNKKFMVSSVGNSSETDLDVKYDAVVIATPMTKDHQPIIIKDFPGNFKGRYERIVCTMIQGTLNHKYFSRDNININEILTTNSSLFFNSIGEQSPTDVTSTDCLKGGSNVYKIFSPDILSEAQLNMLFINKSSVDVFDWLAYPHYEHSMHFAKFELVPGLYYNNAVEMAASAMEMSLISAKNAALLVKQFLGYSLLQKPVIKKEL